MAQCDICLLNESGLFSPFHCNFIATGCKSCQNRCKNEAFYIGGMNICSAHVSAFTARMEEAAQKTYNPNEIESAMASKLQIKNKRNANKSL